MAVLDEFRLAQLLEQQVSVVWTLVDRAERARETGRWMWMTLDELDAWEDAAALRQRGLRHVFTDLLGNPIVWGTPSIVIDMPPRGEPQRAPVWKPANPLPFSRPQP